MNPDQSDDNVVQEPSVEVPETPQQASASSEDELPQEESEEEQERPSEEPLEPEESEESEDDSSKSQTVPDEKNLVSWTAHEYIHIEKSGRWYLLFFVAVLALIALSTFVFQSYTFSGLIVVMAVALFIYTRRPPRVMQYTLSGDQGIYVGERLYHFNDFKAFGLIKDGEHHSIMLIPTKRFAPGLSVYFPEESGEKIVDILGVRLPMQPLKLDFIDLVIRQLRL